MKMNLYSRCNSFSHIHDIHPFSFPTVTSAEWTSTQPSLSILLVHHWAVWVAGDVTFENGVH